MNQELRTSISTTILANEELRHLGRFTRMWRKPSTTLPYYLLAARARLRPFKRTFPTLWGTQMTSYLPEGNTFLYYGYCEANVTNFLLRELTAGMTFFDVGAHVGFYSMLAAELVGDKGSVHSFEPTKWTYDLLSQNTKQYEHVYRNNVGVSSKAGWFTFRDYGPGYGAYNTTNRADASLKLAPPQEYTVETVSLDVYCAEYKTRPDILKIDAEGHEPIILEGAASLLRGHSGKQPLIIMEVAGGEEWAASRSRSFATLESYGYTPYAVAADGTLTAHTLQLSYRYDNLVFLPKNRAAEYVTETV